MLVSLGAGISEGFPEFGVLRECSWGFEGQGRIDAAQQAIITRMRCGIYADDTNRK